jgi:ATP phosphoribosyltransferase
MSKLKIAVQKKGRLNEDSLELLKACGLAIENGKDQLKVTVRNFPVEILYLRNGDIPQYLEDGTVDIAIIGENNIVEKQKNIQIIDRLGFSKCKVSLAVPKETVYRGLSFFNGKKIATSYPVTLQKYLNENNIIAEIHNISGSVEIAPNIGLADGICDIVSSGSTLFKNGLKEIDVIMTSEAVLASSPNLSEAKQDILNKLLFRIKSVQKAKNNKYILMNVPNNKVKAVSDLLPVMKSPTVLPLAEQDWSSLHSVIQEDQFWKVIDELKQAGAEDILIIPIDKMVN